MPRKSSTTTKRKNSGSLVGDNFGPLNNPLSGIFDMGGQNGSAPASQIWEIANNTSYFLISLQRVLLTYAYVIHGPIRTLVDQPVYDAFRGGVKIKASDVSAEDIEDLERFMKKVKFWRILSDAMRWDRLYGGAGVVINTDSNYSQEFNLESITQESKLEFRAADRWELSWCGTPNDPKSMFDFYGNKVHQSRVARIVGEAAPALAAQRLQGWGMSVIECVVRELNNYFKNNNVIFEFLDEAKVDVWKIEGFNANILSSLAKGKVHDRLKYAQSMKNFLNAVALDAKDDFQQKQVTFSGISDIMQQIMISLAAAIRMPMAKIFGLSAKGFASGEDDIENYNSIVEQQRDRAIDALDILVPICCMKVWGYVPDDLSYEFKPLRVLSAEQEENVKTQKFTRFSSLFGQGILNPQEYCEVLNQEGILTMETEVSKGSEPEPPMIQQMIDQGVSGAGEGEASKGSAKAAKEKESEG